MVNCLKTALIFILSFATLNALPQTDSIVLKNKTVARAFYFDKQAPGFYTGSYRNLVTGVEYARPGTEEFGIEINGKEATGKNCVYLRHEISRSGDQQTLNVVLNAPVSDVQIVLQYIMYDSIPLIRKRLEVINHGGSEAALTNLDVERLQFQVVYTYMNEVYANYGTHLTRVPYQGDYNDAAVLLFNPIEKQGVIFGNEAPSVLKRTVLYTKPDQVTMGMGLIDDPFPFKKALAPGETFSSPQTFMYFSSSDKWEYAFEGKFQDFIREKLSVKLFQQKAPPYFIYDTWPALSDTINERTIKECADHLQQAGCDLFIIDVGWYRRAGDFDADPKKFPNGIKPVAQYIKNKGMRAGLWVTVGSVHNKSNVARQHPEWLVKNKEGKPDNLHDGNMQEDGDQWSSALRTMSLGSGYYDHIHQILRSLVKDSGFSYLKLDLSIANSAYIQDYDRTGDYDISDKKLYKDRAASYWIIYERAMNLMDTLKTEFPGLLLDCTFEVWGRYNLVDYALIEHADYDWLTNFDYPPPVGPISIRQMNYDRSRAVPANALLIGNQFMNAPNYRYVYFSMASGATVMVGDPRKLSTADKSFYRKWNAWFKSMDKKYQFTRFRQTYDVFDRATNENWDGCFRFNPEKEGGALFFYRNNSGDSARVFKIPCVHANVNYRIYDPENNRTIARLRGSDLLSKGLTVTISSTYSAKVLGIEKDASKTVAGK